MIKVNGEMRDSNPWLESVEFPFREPATPKKYYPCFNRGFFIDHPFNNFRTFGSKITGGQRD